MEYGYTVMQPNEPFEPFCSGKIFIDQTGNAGTPAYDELTHLLSRGDQVTIPSLTCLGCSLSQILDRWSRIRETGSRVVILDWEDCNAANPALMDSLMEYIHQIQDRLKQSGARNMIRRPVCASGPKPKTIPAEFEQVSEWYKQGQISSRAAAEQLNVSHTTFLRWYRTIPLMD
ncbi:recombinase family protein [Faecalibaculum rodentium]|jgi:DNA invertase Pin-like site-specific DNA recombinase|uniref:recombinase family protein n=1 Tax=Faecalibaculum rodentium TaxID=1702221 RepID=UPI001F566123|nr:hypothetical protein [Faecalibaculum rodentium]